MPRGVLIIRALRSLLAIALLAAGAGVATADDGDPIRGIVIDAASGAPIADATVLAGAVDGATPAEAARFTASTVSDATGRFELGGLAPGPVALAVSAPGYVAMTVIVSAGERADTVRVGLAADGDGEVIEIVSEAPELAASTSYQLDQDQIRMLPGSGNDVIRAVQSLPGVGRMQYGIIGLRLRGAFAGDTKVFLDGIEVPLAYHFGGVTSFYPSTLLDHLTVNPGAADVANGRGLGGVVAVHSRAPRTDRWRVGGELGVFDVSTYAEGPVAGGGIALGVRRSYIDAILPSVMDASDLVLPRYYDGQLRWDHRALGGELSAQLFFSDDAMRFVASAGIFAQRFARASLRYRRHDGATSYLVQPWLGFSEMRFSNTDYDDSQIVIRHLPIGLRGEVIRDTSWGHLAGGLDLQPEYATYDVPPADPGPGWSLQFGKFVEGWREDLGAWAEARWRIAGGKLSVKPGLRVDYFSQAERVLVSPRVVVSHELTPWLTTRETFGVHRRAFNLPRAWTEPAHTASSVHASVGAEIKLPVEIELAATGYYLGVYGNEGSSDGEGGSTVFAPGLVPMVSNALAEELRQGAGKRRSSGLELSLRRQTDRWLGWLSYTLSRTVGEDGFSVASLDQTHNLNLVGSVRLGAWQLGARFAWVTGFPYTPPGPDDDVEEYVDDQHNAARIADYVSLDLRVDRRWRRPWGTFSLFLDVHNVTNADNPEDAGVDLETGELEVQRGLPTLPLIGVAFTVP